MPDRGVTIGIRDQAQRKIAEAIAALSVRFGVAPPADRGYEGRDQEYLAARELEGIAGFLTALAESGEETGKAKEASIQWFQDEIDTWRSLAEQSEKASLALHEANTEWSEFGKVVQQLLIRSVTEDALREQLEAAGFIQSEFSETRGWVVSVIGIGPDLAAIIEQGKPETDDLGDVPRVEPPDEDGESGDHARPRLDDLTRAQLNELAGKLGIEGAGEMANKAAVIEAIQSRPRE